MKNKITDIGRHVEAEYKYFVLVGELDILPRIGVNIRVGVVSGPRKSVNSQWNEMPLGSQIVEEFAEGFIKIFFRHVDLPQVALLQFCMITDGLDDCIGLLAACEYLLQDGHDVWVVVRLTSESVQNARNVNLV